jgi:hypothetical protein
MVAVAGTLGGIWMGHILGRRAARADRLIELERAAIADTREWLLDVLDVLAAAADRNWWSVRRRGRALRDKRYPRNYPELIVDDQLLEELTVTLPAAYEALPRVPRELAAQVGSIKFIVNRAMLAQERELERTGSPKVASADQQRRLAESAERIQRRTDSIRGWRRIALGIRTVVPWP